MNAPLVAAALLAPVPEAHLRDGAEVCAEQGRVAFGSRAWEVLRRFDVEAGAGSEVLIYASHPSENRGPVVSWRATWVGVVDSLGGAHPDGDILRPPSTTEGGEDGVGYWAVFWEVAGLRELDRSEWISVGRLTDIHGRRYRAPFVPEGPTLLGAAP